METKLNLGCGNDYKEGYINIDNNPKVKTDIKNNFMDEIISLKDNSVDEIFARSIFEHLGNPLNFLLECKRILKPGAKLIIFTDNGNWLMSVHNRIKVVHGDYRFGEKFDERDMHFQFFQPEHLRNYFWKAGFNRNTIDIKLINYIADEKKQLKNLIVRSLLRFFFGKRLGMKWIYAEVEK